MLTFNIKDFGPIIKGDVALKPLTVFVGPNNSGKSYLAMLIYAVFHGARQLSPYFPMRRMFRYPRGMLYTSPMFHERMHSVENLLSSEATGDSLKQWLQQISGTLRKASPITLDRLPEPIQLAFDNFVKSYFHDYAAGLSREIKRCFGADLVELHRTGSGSTGFELSIAQTNPKWTSAMRVSDGSLSQQQVLLDISDLEINDLPVLHYSAARLQRTKKDELADIGELIFETAFTSFHNKLWREAYYMPAARSGIQQAHKALTSFLVSRSSLVGLEKIEVPQLSGVVVDFLSNLIRLEKRRASPFRSISSFLEEEVLRGSIAIETGKLEYPDMYYEASEGGKLSIHRTSSMISELASIILLLKHVADPGDVLIIEEPESHLHPANQRKFAQALVKLVRRGIQILITTHSDYFLDQLANFVRLGRLRAEERHSVGGYDEDDFLAGDELAVYLFRHDAERGGSTVVELSEDLEDGIAEPDSQQVAEALYQETVKLQRRLLGG